ncbi:MAG: hypothetical protein E7047_08120 [Lentisphaerae bacterium]|nr:hypothetical protein [Lentisphaerota bacterium]
MRQILIAFALGIFLTGCVFDVSSDAPVVGGLSLIDFTDRSGEEYCEKMGKLFAEHFSAEELAKISAIYQDGNYMLLLNEYLENPGPEQTRKLDACLRAKWGEDIYDRVNTGVFHGKSCQLKRSFMAAGEQNELRAKLDAPTYHSILVGIDAMTLQKKQTR